MADHVGGEDSGRRPASEMSREETRRLVVVLAGLAQFQDVDGRRTLLDVAGVDQPRLIDLQGSPQEVAQRTVSKLPGESLGHLVELLRAQTLDRDQAEFVGELTLRYRFDRVETGGEVVRPVLGESAAANGPRESVSISPPPRSRDSAFGFDVFLCHNSQEKAAVREIAERLKAAGLRVWLDKWELPPGRPWQPELERQITSIKTAAVFVGEAGLGPWQRQEIDAYLHTFVQQQCPVIPVILPGASEVPELPIFLKAFTWVDFREPEPEPFEQLVWGITGEKPSQRVGHLKAKRVEQSRASETRLAQIAVHDPRLALVGLRIEIESRLRSLAAIAGLEQRKPLSALTKALQDRGVLSPRAASTLTESILAGNRAAHGETVQEDVAEWALADAPAVLATLDIELARHNEPGLEAWIERALSVLDVFGDEVEDTCLTLLKMAKRDGRITLGVVEGLKSRAKEILLRLEALEEVGDDISPRWGTHYQITEYGLALLSRLEAGRGEAR